MLVLGLLLLLLTGAVATAVALDNTDAASVTASPITALTAVVPSCPVAEQPVKVVPVLPVAVRRKGSPTVGVIRTR